MPSVGPNAPPPEPGLERLVGEARRDLAGRLAAAPDAIDVLEARAVTWPDAGLGCPQPGMRYRQVPTDGALIRLRACGREYEYHSGGRRGPFLCERPPGASGARDAASRPGDTGRA